MNSEDPTLRRLADGTLLVPFRGDSPPSWLLHGIADGLGGVCLFAVNGNVTDAEQLSRLSAALRSSGDPVIAIDEEGGDVTRLAHATGSPYPGNAALGVVDDTAVTGAVYRALGSELAAAGINLDLAPSGDVNTTEENPIIGIRSFGSDPALVSRHTAAAVRGLQEAGVASCAKHFPGHGATRQDSHHELPTVDIALELLERRELAPFRAAIAASAQAIMTAHVRVPALTGAEPATVSTAAITGLLRGRMGYRGVVVSDALEMRAISSTVGIPEGAVRCLAAGADLLCLGAVQEPDVVRATSRAIVDAVRAGRLPAERLEEAHTRVRRLHAWLSPARWRRTRRPTLAAAGRAEQDGAVGLAAARRAVRVTGDPTPLRTPLVVEIETPPTMAAGPLPWGIAHWLPEAEAVRVDGTFDEVPSLLAGAEHRSLIIAVRDAHRHPRARRLVSILLAARPDATVVEMGLPAWRPPCATYVATYGAAAANARAAAEILTRAVDGPPD